MASTPLVDDLVSKSASLLQEMDKSGLAVYAAYWMFSDDSASWSFNVASDMLGAFGSLGAYRAIQKVLIDRDIDIPLQLISLVESNNTYLKLLQVAINVENGRVTFVDNVINGVQIPDSVILRVISRPAKVAKSTARTTALAARPKSDRSKRTPSHVP